MHSRTPCLGCPHDREPVGDDVAQLLAEDRARYRSQLERDLRAPPGSPLSGARQERNAVPAPVVDLGWPHGEGPDTQPRPNIRLVEMAGHGETLDGAGAAGFVDLVCGVDVTARRFSRTTFLRPCEWPGIATCRFAEVNNFGLIAQKKASIRAWPAGAGDCANARKPLASRSSMR